MTLIGEMRRILQIYFLRNSIYFKSVRIGLCSPSVISCDSPWKADAPLHRHKSNKNIIKTHGENSREVVLIVLTSVNNKLFQYCNGSTLCFQAHYLLRVVASKWAQFNISYWFCVRQMQKDFINKSIHQLLCLQSSILCVCGRDIMLFGYEITPNAYVGNMFCSSYNFSPLYPNATSYLQIMSVIDLCYLTSKLQTNNMTDICNSNAMLVIGSVILFSKDGFPYYRKAITVCPHSNPQRLHSHTGTTG